MTHWFLVTHREADLQGIWLPEVVRGRLGRFRLHGAISTRREESGEEP
jgi:hypothetical protein